MNQQEELLASLQSQLADLRARNRDFQLEIEHLSKKIYELTEMMRSTAALNDAAEIPNDISVKNRAGEEELKPVSAAPVLEIPTEEPEETEPWWKTNLEKFIGENLISKIGIGITIIGVGIGTKYAIDHELISPAMRILLGYLLGLCFTGIAWKLKRQYHNFSAVLCSGAMAIFYLITLAAYSYFDLIPRWMAFSVMVIVTVITISSALVYNLQLIAHIGLVGAYAVPFLLSDGSGKFEILFGYMALINTGVLLISIKKYWKPLHYSAFIITWLVVVQWFIHYRNGQPELFPAFWFLLIFFTIFYLLFIAYKMIREQHAEIEDILLLIANSGLFYGIGYALILDAGKKDYQGIFTLLIAAIHALVWMTVSRKKIQDSLLIYIIGGLSVVFLTIAVPVQFEGRWVTLLWSAESVMLFLAGRKMKVSFFEGFSYLLLLLAFFSLLHDWTFVYSGFIPGRPDSFIMPIINVNFLVSLAVIASMSLFNWSVYRTGSLFSERRSVMLFINAIVPALFIIVLYFTFFMEISCQADQSYAGSVKTIAGAGTSLVIVWNETIPYMGFIAEISYSLLFVSLLAFINRKFIKSLSLGLATALLIILTLAVTLSFGLVLLGELRGVFQAPDVNGYYHGVFLIAVRYLLIALTAVALYALYQAICYVKMKYDFQAEYDVIMHLAILTVLSNELVNWLDLAGNQNTYKLWLSILFGAYAVFMIIIGILLKKKHVRICAMILFGLTLAKLFFYDLAFLDTLSKTVVFLALGMLLLVMAFLYNKYTKRIFDEH